MTEIEFKNVHFDYFNKQNLFNNLNFKIFSNKRNILFGKSGAGKSTICELLLKFYQPSLGKILIDKVDLSNIDTANFREQISYVRQESFIFCGTILDNIIYSKETANLSEVIEASKIADIYGFVQSLPEKYNTYVGEKGAYLSVGQRQKIAIARAILKSPKILILDEATSNIDEVSEKKIYQALYNSFKNSTQIIVTHNLDALKCDHIINIKTNPKIFEI